MVVVIIKYTVNDSLGENIFKKSRSDVRSHICKKIFLKKCLPSAAFILDFSSSRSSHKCIQIIALTARTYANKRGKLSYEAVILIQVHERQFPRKLNSKQIGFT